MKLSKNRFPAMFLAAGLLLGVSTACVSSPYQGLLFTYTSHHIYGKQQGSQISSAQVLKKGESCAWSGLLLREVFYGSGRSFQDAMKEAGITKVAVVDRKSLTILPGIVYMECVQVFGE